MKCNYALFHIVTAKGPMREVYFWENTIVVQDGQRELLVLPNEDKKYKPCVTHAIELVKKAVGEPKQTPHAKKRLKTVSNTKKPRLRVHK